MLRTKGNASLGLPPCESDSRGNGLLQQALDRKREVPSEARPGLGLVFFSFFVSGQMQVVAV